MPDLKRGSTGSKVKELQIYLGVEPANGNFGPATEAALKEWQTKNGLADTGIATNQQVLKLAMENSDLQILALQEMLNEAGAPTKLLNDDYGDMAIAQANNNDYEESLAEAEALKIQNYDDTATLTNNLANSVNPVNTAGTFESGIYDIDSLLLQLAQTPQPVIGQTATVQPNTTNISNIQNTANNTENTTNAVSNVQSDQSRVIQNVQNPTQLAISQAETTENTVNNVSQNTTALTENNTTNQSAVTQSTEPLVNQPARVESSQLISKSETSQIINPPNQVVGTLENVGSSLNQSIQTMTSDLSTNISNMKSGDNVSNSQVTQVDQSSIYNTAGEKMAAAPVDLKSEKVEEPNASINLNEVYLSAIYEALVNGIKVKITT